ncbi:MAG TPA: IS3 family transposase [Niabella sp.]|nr:IS3 family transposase [Niabella sp.]
MKQHYPTIGLGRLCRLFGKTRQAYYEHGWRDSEEQLQQALVLDLVGQVRHCLPKTGGHKLLAMIKKQLQQHSITMGRDRFFALLGKYDLLVKRKRKYARTTDSDHPYYKWPNLIENMQPQAPQQLWVSDITYLRTESGFVYLSLITDAYSRKIIGHHVSQRLKAQGCILALQKAIGSLKQPVAGRIIHHSDRGIQYCCDQYVHALQNANIQISMTQSGSPYDNAIAERVNGILKTELDLDKTFQDYAQAVAATHHAIDRYNRLRPHLSCNNLTPQQAHQTRGPLTKRWKKKNFKLKNSLNMHCKAKSVSLEPTVKQ